MTGRPLDRWPRPRRPRQSQRRRYRVHYDLAYDGGAAQWDGYYRTRVGARVAVWWHRHVASWGGVAELFDQRG